MESNRNVRKKIRSSPLICRICGDVARGKNFDVFTCVSCKAFFRRHALRPSGTLRCTENNNCEITVEKRIKCPACRLKKCFEFDMKPYLIRSITQHQLAFNKIQKLMMNKQQQMQLSTPQPLSLLRNDRSSLTTEQWNLLSNIINIYDEQNLVNRIKCLLTGGSTVPIKLRVKPSFALDYVNKCISGIQTIIKRSSHFHNLELDSRRTIIQHNIYLTSCLNAVFVSMEVDLWSNMDFGMSYNTLFGSDYFTQFSKIPKRMDPNGTLIKIMLFIIAFSSNYSIVIYNNQQNIRNTLSSINLIHIQDIFVTLLWKYLIYQYGYSEAILRFSSLIKTVLDVLYVLEDLANTEVYHQMLNMVMAQTEQLFILDD